MYTVGSKADIFQLGTFMLLYFWGHILAAAKDGVLYIIGAIVSNDIFDQSLETSVICRYSLRSYDSDFFHSVGAVNLCLQNHCNVFNHMLGVV